MTIWIKVNEKLPDIPKTRDYIPVEVKLNNGNTIKVHYCRRWGFRDANFTKLENVVEWTNDDKLD